MLNVKYFAYGSNISIDRLKNRVERWGESDLQAGVPYTLQNHALIFNAGSRIGSWAFANVVPRQGESVEGILYDITSEQFERLDKYEMLYYKAYFQIDKNTIGCIYLAYEENTGGATKPSLDYLNIIIDGCLETGLTRTYNTLIKYKAANYKLKKNKHRELDSSPRSSVKRVVGAFFSANLDSKYP